MHKSKNKLLSERFVHFYVITFLFFFVVSSKAQLNDTSKVSLIGSTKISTSQFHSPRKAALMSTFLPGSGQIYNKKYWKVPIIYVGFGALAYSINFNQSKYRTYLNAYKDRLDGATDDKFKLYTNDNLNSLQTYYHRYRDLSVIGALALYLLNIVDATVDAHLFAFDVSEDLSFRFRPTLINTACVNQYKTGFALEIKF